LEKRRRRRSKSGRNYIFLNFFVFCLKPCDQIGRQIATRATFETYVFTKFGKFLG